MLRILILFGLTRGILKSEFKSIKLNSIDKILLLWVSCTVIIYSILWDSYSAFINRLGMSVDVLGLYFFMRAMLRDVEDIKRILKAFLIVGILLSISMTFEWFTSKNLFSTFGGVPEFTLMRDGRLRCQGPFQHPILAGSFGASLFPIALSFWWVNRRGKVLPILGCISATIITATSSSSGPAITYIAGLLGLSMWFLKNKMRIIRYGIFFTIIALHIVMKAPVWGLIQRVGVFAGSTSYHRYHLIDQFIRRIDEWWLLGTQSTANWDEFGGLWDVTNHYIQIAKDGGLLSLILFIILISLCFKTIGQAWKVEDDKNIQILYWAIGASLFSHVVSFMGVSYFDQIIVLWFAIICIISTIYNITNNNIALSQT